MCSPSPPPHHQGVLGGGHDDGVLVKALHLLHAGHAEGGPLLQNDVMGRPKLPIPVCIAIALYLRLFVGTVYVPGRGAMTSPKGTERALPLLTQGMGHTDTAHRRIGGCT